MKINVTVSDIMDIIFYLRSLSGSVSDKEEREKINELIYKLERITL